GLLPYAAPLRHVPIRARAGLLARLDAIDASDQQRMIVLPVAARERGRPLRWLRMPASPRLVAFAAVPLAIALAIVGIMADVINDQQEQIATIESAKKEFESIVLGEADDEPPDETTFINSTSAQQARAKLIVNHETNSALILARDLPAIDDGQQYIAWLRLSAPDEYGRVGILEVDEDGRASLSVEPRDAIESYTEVIVTLEANGDVSAPTGPRVMTAAVTPGR
ncbi:MAG: anti-sigma factor, partial [Thermomicrobiales bacterium]